MTGSYSMLKVLGSSASSRTEMCSGVVLRCSSEESYLTPIGATWFRVQHDAKANLSKCTMTILDQTSEEFDLASISGRFRLRFPRSAELTLLIESYTYVGTRDSSDNRAPKQRSCVVKEMKCGDKWSLLYQDVSRPGDLNATNGSGERKLYTSFISDNMTRDSNISARHSNTSATEAPDSSFPFDSSVDSSLDYADWVSFLPRRSAPKLVLAGSSHRDRLTRLMAASRESFMNECRDDLRTISRLKQSLAQD